MGLCDTPSLAPLTPLQNDWVPTPPNHSPPSYVPGIPLMCAQGIMNSDARSALFAIATATTGENQNVHLYGRERTDTELHGST